MLDQEEIETLLKRQNLGRLACCAGDRPYVVPINYHYDGSNIYAASGPGTKIDAMRVHPRVCFEIDQVDDLGTWRSVVADGVYEELTDDAERSATLSKLRMSWDGQSSSRTICPAGIIVFRIHVHEKSGRFMREH
jgi:uncharacterized protein